MEVGGCLPIIKFITKKRKGQVMNDSAQIQTTRGMTVGQLKDLIALAVQAIPSDATFEVAGDVLGRKTDFITHVRAYFPSPADLINPVKQWEAFYLKYFNLKIDFSGVKIPERTEAQKKEFTRLLIIVGTLKLEKVYSVLSKHFPCWKYADNLDTAVPTNERGLKNGTYAIWVRDTVEADEVHKNKSVNMVKQEGLKNETLLERMLHELKYFAETGKHLDVGNWTLCSGSHDSDGSVPRAGWGVGEFRVCWLGTDDRNGSLRSREVVS